MAHGKSVKLFLVDGTPNGILTAEIINWTGHILSAPRSKLKDLIQREECQQSTGIYFLVGSDESNSTYPLVYIGESDNIAQRLAQHNRTEESGGKDFWNKVCVVTGKDQNITKAHIKYLESRLIDIALSNGQCQLKNGTAHIYNRLPESDIADMEYFLEQIQVILPVLGYEFLKEQKRPSELKTSTIILSTPQVSENTYSSEVEDLVEQPAEFYFSVKGIEARAKVIDGEFYVLKGSRVRQDVSQPEHNYMQTLRPSLLDNGTIDSSAFTFTKDYLFNSPSAAGAVILGRSCNGRKDWKQVGTDLTFGEWQEDQVNGEYEEILHLETKTSQIQNLYHQFKDAFLNLNVGLDIVIKKKYIAFKKNDFNVVTIYVFPSKIHINLQQREGILKDESGLLEYNTAQKHPFYTATSNNDLKYITNIVKKLADF